MLRDPAVEASPSVEPSSTTTFCEPFNIVNFIENNPNSKLTDTYNNRLLGKIKDQFSESEQQIYVTSFYCYLNYNQTTDFVVDLDNIWRFLGFSTKQNAKTVLTKNFIENNDYKISLMQPHKRPIEVKGGQNKETILMNIDTFKKICMMAGTKKAKEIHNYYIKLENILHEVIKEDSEEMTAKFEKLQNKNAELENKTSELENQNIALKKTNEIDKHTMLCNEYDKKQLVYVIKLETLNDGKFIVKIGESQDIKQRCQAISACYGIRVLIIDLFPCDFNYDFEQFLHRQPVIYKYKYNGLINKTKKSNEAFLLPDMKVYTKIKQFIQRNLHNYNSKNSENMKYTAMVKAMEMYKDDKEKVEQILKIIASSTNVDFGSTPVYENTRVFPADDELKENTDIGENENVTIEENDEIGELINETIEENDVEPTINEPLPRPNKYSPKVQIYNPTDLTRVVKVFDSITEATREIEGSSYTHIKYASRHRTIYKNLRWFIIGCNEPDQDTARNIGETVDSNAKKTGMVAMLNLEKNRIIKVFLLQKDAAEYCKTHTSLICTAIRYGSALCGHYFVAWDLLAERLKLDYLVDNELPKITKKSKGCIVQQINPNTGVVEHEYPSITDATKEMKVSNNSIKRSSAENVAVSGWKWKIL